MAGIKRDGWKGEGREGEREREKERERESEGAKKQKERLSNEKLTSPSQRVEPGSRNPVRVMLFDSHRGAKKNEIIKDEPVASPRTRHPER